MEKTVAKFPQLVIPKNSVTGMLKLLRFYVGSKLHCVFATAVLSILLYISRET